MYFKLFLSLLIMMSPLLGSEQKKIILITSLYNEKVIKRRKEYIECLNKNFKDPTINKIHVFYDKSRNEKNNNAILKKLKKSKISLSFITKRPTFSEIFDFVNTNYPDHLIIIANADIYFDKTLELVKSIDFENTFLALTRWNVIKQNGRLDNQPYHDRGVPIYFSQDVWIFKTPIKNFDTLNIKIGTAFCDGNIAYQAYKAGYKVMNPCLSIITHHLHLSNLRRWTFPPATEQHETLTVPWCHLENPIYSSEENIYTP